MNETIYLEPWIRVRVLGRGGFGLVTLWQNRITEENIAIKYLCEKELKYVIKPKHKERWCKEVEIMHKLKHRNIVSALPVPDPLSSLQTTIPLLAMEYCALGDLRQVLVKPESSCGLQESTIIDILRDISNGLNYLHSCKVIHRDLKPDNIVLKSEEDRVIYKLIDLGYAKELEQGSQCESLVGTVQYLAPELFMGKPYTCSVDYWSFGQVAHEIITGHRPFLPGLTPAVWMKEIQNKKRNVISVVQTWSGDTIHSSSLSRVNHLSSCLREYFEKWLQLALDWDGRTRGRDLDTNQLTFFTALNHILDKQVVRVFSFPTCETLSYAVSRDTSAANLQAWISRDAGLEMDDQILLLPTGKALSPKANLLSSLPSKRCNQDVALYLYASGLMKIQSKPVLKPLFVGELLEDPKRLLEYPQLKRSASDAVFFLQSEAALYHNILAALKTKVESLKQKTLALEALSEDVDEEWIQVEAIHQFFTQSHRADLENYIELRKADRLPSNEFVQKWIKKANEVEAKLNELRSSANRSQRRHDVNAARINVTELSNLPVLLGTKSPLDDLLADGLVLFDKVQNIPKDVRGHPMCNTDMARVLLRAMEASAKQLRSPAFNNCFLKIFESEVHVAKLISPLTICLKSTKVMRQVIESTQKERQREVWTLIVQTISDNSKKGLRTSDPALENDKSNSKLSPLHIPKTVHHDLVSPIDENMLRLDFRVSEPVSVPPVITGSLCTAMATRHLLAHRPDVNEVISCNNEWRYRAQDMAQSCHQLVKDIQSLNWDFLNQQ